MLLLTDLHHYISCAYTSSCKQHLWVERHQLLLQKQLLQLWIGHLQQQWCIVLRCCCCSLQQAAR